MDEACCPGGRHPAWRGEGGPSHPCLLACFRGRLRSRVRLAKGLAAGPAAALFDVDIGRNKAALAPLARGGGVAPGSALGRGAPDVALGGFIPATALGVGSGGIAMR